METSQANHFLPILRSMSKQDLEREIAKFDLLRVKTKMHNGKRLDVAYAPFEYINRDARIVIVGITPGRQQMGNALRKVHEQLALGATDDKVLQAAKVFASFSGPMRTNLVSLLDEIGIANLLGVSSTANLWEKNSHLVHFTSALKYPVFVGENNYSGAPSMVRTPFLKDQLNEWLVPEMKLLRSAIFVPLGPKVGEALSFAAPFAGVPENHILQGLPHPSGANAERIAYFLGRKPKALLSPKTNALTLDGARDTLISKIERIGA